MFTRELNFSIDREDVFSQIDCYPDSPLYDEISEEYEEILETISNLCEPVLLMEYGTIDSDLAKEGLIEGTPVLMVLSSVGGKISEYATACFAGGDYLKGMLADAMADSALFSLNKEIAYHIKKECGQLKMGVRRRLEAPQDISMEAQKKVWEHTKAKERCGILISSGFMLDPVKSNAEIYVLTTDQEVFMTQHNCRNCNRYDCKGRNIPDIPVKVIHGEQIYHLSVPEKKSIWEIWSEDRSLTITCERDRPCGNCEILVTEGYLPITDFDKSFFTEEELALGYRLGCKAFPAEPVTIQLP